MGAVRYLLDTCAFLWLAQQPAMVSPRAAAAIDDAGNELFVSDVSIWEITLKHSAGRLPLPGAPRRWIPAKLSYHQLQSLRLDHAALYRSGELPRVHPDPFDRLLAAQAIEAGMTLLSPDAPLSLLGAARLW
jgi:PIN domain nuclease of toxin-antitoxin system